MADEPSLSTPDAGDLNTAARKVAAQRGWAMQDGSYPIRPLDMHGRADLQKAIRAVGRGGASHEAIRRHIIKRARAIGLVEMIPENWTSAGESRAETGEQPRAPIEFRDDISRVGAVNFAQRLVEMIVVPYEQPATVTYRGEDWEEQFDRGAFDGLEQRPNRVRANRDHDRTRVVGKAVKFFPSRREGLVSEIRIAKTALGDETLALADEDMLSASVGFGVRGSDQILDKSSRTRRITRAFLDHIAFTSAPAYEGASVLSVRNGDEPAGAAGLPPLNTPDLDELLAWQRARRR